MMGINPDLRINEWMSFVLLLPLGFGISFQLPLVMLFLERIGLIIGEDLPGLVADGRAGDFRAGDDPHAHGRSLHHAADGLSLDVPLLWRRAALQGAAEGQEPLCGRMKA